MSAKSLVHSICALLERGFAPYHGPMPQEHYKALGCETKKRAQWFCDAGQRYICVGCPTRHCTLLSPPGVWAVLTPGKPRKAPFLAYARFPSITVEELLRVKRVLRTDEVCFCLNIGRSEVYEKVEKGELEKLAAKPFRVTADSVLRELERVSGA